MHYTKSYKHIKDEIANLSRREQYSMLLSTTEWRDFRDLIIFSDGYKCTKCERAGGLIREEMPFDEWWELHENVASHNRAYRENCKVPEFNKEQLDILTGRKDGTIQGLMPSFSRSKIIGEVILQVHHKLYIINKLPWQYKRQNVETLCSECHKQIHKSTIIYTYQDESLSRRRVMPICERCGGEGYIHAFRHVADGICFECMGEGVIFSDGFTWELASE